LRSHFPESNAIIERAEDMTGVYLQESWFKSADYLLIKHTSEAGKYAMLYSKFPSWNSRKQRRLEAAAKEIREVLEGVDSM